MHRRSIPLAILMLFATVAVTDAQLVINEVVGANQSGLTDADGNTSDWLEIVNTDAAPVDLTGFGLTDDPLTPLEWTFPPIALAPGDRRVVFASGKDLVDVGNHLETVIREGDGWRYRLGDSEPPADWNTVGFVDTTWSEGPSGIGYGDGDDATVVPTTISVYARKTIQVDDPSLVDKVFFHIDYDDGFVAYLNGVEIARTGLTGTPPPHDELAFRDDEAVMYTGAPAPPFQTAIDPQTLLVPGLNTLAIQVHNFTATDDDMTLIPFLTFGMTVPPAIPLGAPDAVLPSLPQLHTNFKLNAAGETLVLSDAAGVAIDQVDTGQSYYGLSRGRSPDGAGVMHIFEPPTPHAANAGIAYPDFAERPAFSQIGGFYAGGTSVIILSPTPGAAVYYTIDGSDPDSTDTLVSSPVDITETTPLRARAYEPGMYPSLIETATYFVDETPTLPVTSIVTEPAHLFDANQGMYVNFTADWERPFHIEYFDSAGGLLARFPCGAKIRGGFSRERPQKPFALFARGGYGTDTIQYPLFAERPFTEYQRYLLRQGGTDWCKAHHRDGLMHRITAGVTDLDRLAFEPALLFINGEYWGIQHLREKPDRFFLAQLHGVDPDNIDLLELNAEVIDGDDVHYQQMMDFVTQNDLADDANFAVVETMMETDNFADYEIFEIYFRNADWPGNNIKYWRPRTPDGRWRWILFDLEAGMRDPAFNMLEVALDPNHLWATTLIRNLLDNEEFRHRFINRYADHMNSSFLPSRMQPMADEIRAQLEPEIVRHFTRWSEPLSEWTSAIASIDNFIQVRTQYARQHLMDRFAITNTYTLSLDVNPPGAGGIELASIEVDSTWSGTYFEGIPVTLTAKPAIGWNFAGWSDGSLPQTATVIIDPIGDYAVTALYAPADSIAIVINEINYRSELAFNPEDWVELWNPSAESVDMSGWEFKDGDDVHIFAMPEGTVLDAGAFVVLARDSLAFATLFPQVSPVLGDLGFGFSSTGETLRLYDDTGFLMDWVPYASAPPWPVEPNGLGPTLELISPDLDQTLATSWAASLISHGTPGAANSVASQTSVAPASIAPLHTYLSGAFPNPFNPTTTIGYGVSSAGPIELVIYDIAGRRVRTLVDSRLEPGHFEVVWDGRNDRGQAVASAVYFYALRAGGEVMTSKLVLLK